MVRLEVTDNRIKDFYEKNPQIDFQAVNLIFVNLFERLMHNMNETMTESIQSQLVYSMAENHSELSNIKQSIVSLKDTVTSMDKDVMSKMFSKFTDVKEEYVNDVKQIVQIHTYDKILPMIENNNHEYLLKSTENNKFQDKFINDLSEILNKFHENKSSQQQNDKQLSNIITKLYPTSEVHVPIKNNTTGLIILKRQGKPNLLVENRDTDTNISTDEVQSFATNIDEYNCNGIFISQNSGISTKKNYQIEMHNNNIIVFVHEAQYNPSKIEAAIDIIDQLFNKMRQIKYTGIDDCVIPKDVMDSINNEYQLFLSQKNAVIEVFKESQKKVLAQVDEIRFPSLDKFLSTKYSAPIQKTGLKCDLCKSYSANNLKALAAHKRGCIRKNTIITNTVAVIAN
jgi:predicted house-cleaning noncanonical NTP pyrophosphatase (MazG superfamily)